MEGKKKSHPHNYDKFKLEFKTKPKQNKKTTDPPTQTKTQHHVVAQRFNAVP